MKRDRIKRLFEEKQAKEATVYGWVRTNRAQAQFGFLNVNDGSTILNLQVVYDQALKNFEEISKFRVGMSVKVVGEIILTPDAKQPLEMHAKEVIMLGDCPENYPNASVIILKEPKKHIEELEKLNGGN